MAKAFGEAPTPEQILHYIYGVFYSNIYRSTYAPLLKIDFPRVPFTADYDLFVRLGKLGKTLVELHLVKSPLLEKPIAKFQGGGGNLVVQKIHYKAQTQKLFINNDKYFEGISKELWEYQIGGYKVLQKYLKDRKGRVLDDPIHYCRIATSLFHTIAIQKEIDELYVQVEKQLIDFEKGD